MKKIYILICIMVGTKLAPAQVWLGLYGVRASITQAFVPEVGGGFAFSMMSKAMAPSKGAQSEVIQIQYGMNFYWSALGHRTFQNVPLAAPQSGLSKVTLNNSFFGMNVLARLTLANKSRFAPYGEAVLGYRGTFTSMSVDPYVRNYGYEEESDHNLARAGGLNYGIGGGITTALTKSKRIKLDLGVSYIEQIARGNYVDLASASADQGGINVNMRNAPMGILMLNVGLLFYIEDDDSDDDDCNCKCNHSHRNSSWTGTGWGGRSGGWSNRVNVNGGGVRTR